MLALWHLAAGCERISALVAIGQPAVALRRVRVRMPLSVLTVRGLGYAVLRSPSPRPHELLPRWIDVTATSAMRSSCCGLATTRRRLATGCRGKDEHDLRDRSDGQGR